MNRLRLLLMALPAALVPGLLLAANRGPADPLAAARAQAAAEARAAEARVARLEEAARTARDEATRLRARQAAAAEAIAAAEARISAADAEARLTAAALREQQERLAQQQAPAGSLLAGLALMASRPPLVALLDEGSTEEFVRVRVLLDSTLPVFRARAGRLRAELEHGRRLQDRAEDARSALQRHRGELSERRREFARLEEEALRTAALRSGEAIGAGDVALAMGEEAARLGRQSADRRGAAKIAAELARLPPAPERPEAAAERAQRSALAYRLPAIAPVTEGFGSVSETGIRSRGLTLATARGARLAVPASGIVRFSGPFRKYDGIVIIDHGNGWMSLILNVASPLKPGSRVAIGDPLGRSLGPVGVELSHNGHHVSPALIAGSSQILSKRAKDG